MGYSDNTSCVDSAPTQTSGMSEQRLWLCAAISAGLHAVIAILIGHFSIATYEQMKPIEAFLVSFPTNAVAAPMKSTPPLRAQNESHPVQTASPFPQATVFPTPVSAPIKTDQPDISRIKETAVALNPAQNVPEAGVANGGNLTHVAPIPVKTGQNIGAAAVSGLTGGNDNMGDMMIGETGAPQFIHREPPAYPFLARKLGKEGKVIVRLTLDESGRQKNIEIIEPGGFGFTDAAIAALKKSIFSPARRNGKSVASRVLVPVRFILNE